MKPTATTSPGMLRWRAAAGELAPDKTLVRMAGSAKYVVATVTVVGTTLSALGVASTSSTAGRPLVRGLTLVAVTLAAAAVATALAALVLRTRAIELDDLLQVRQWYEREFRRAGWITAAGWLLVAAVVLATVTGLVSVLTAAPRARAGIEVTTDAVVVSATVDGLDPDDIVTVRLYRGADVLFVASQQPDTAGTVTVSSTVKDPAGQASYRLVVDGGGVHREVAVARP